jgi:twitching motility protein PilT
VDTIEHEVRQPQAAANADDLAVLDQMLVTLVESRGSDLHLTVGSPPMMRVDGALRPIAGYGKLNSADTELLARAAVNQDQWETFQREQEMDFAHSIVARSSGPSPTRSSRWTSWACRSRWAASPTCPAAWCW